MASRVRVRSEYEKGAEALRHSAVTVMDNLAGSVTYHAVIGPFETDIDVEEIAITVGGVKPAANGSNTLDIFNGTVAGAVTMMTQMTDALATYGFSAQTVGVPVKPPVIATAKRVTAGTPVVVRFVAAGSNAAAPAAVTVRLGYDIPVFDPRATAMVAGAYDGGL